METAALNIRQWVKWTGGLLAIWVLTLVPAWADQRPPVPERQTYVSSASVHRQVNEPDCSPTVFHQEAIALVSPRAGFSFVPSFVFLLWLLSDFSRIPGIEQAGRNRGSFFCFSFLRPIFEHQIPINAP